MADNPIKYSDFISPDNSVTDLIKQLEQVQTGYEKMKNEIVASAKELEAAIKKVNNTTTEGQEKTKKAVSDAERLAKAQDNLTQSQSDTAKQVAELKRQQAEQNAITKLTAKLNASAEGSFNKLSAQYALNSIQLSKLSKEEREATESGKALVAETKSIRDEMKRLKAEQGDNTLNVGNYPDMTEAMAGYSDKLNEVLGLNTQFGSSLANLAKNGGGFNNLLGSIGSSVKSMGATMLTLMANPVFLSIAGIAAAGVAFKFWYDYNTGLVEATRLTQQFTGKSGDDLKGYRNEVQALADMYGKDFQEVLVSANAVSKQFGISQEEALAGIKDGFIAGADANGEFLENLKEYPAYFKEAGLTANQFIAITAQTNKSGIYSDKGVDTIKEANLRLREMTTSTAAALQGIGMSSEQVQKDLQSGAKTTFQVMQEVSTKLNELPESSAAVGTAIADIFGGPGEDAGLAYLKTLKDIDTNLATVKGSTGELGKLQEEQLRSQLELNNVLASLFDATGGSFETMTTTGKTFLNDVIIGTIEGTVSLINYFIKLYNDSMAFRAIIQLIVTDFKILWNTITSLFTYIVDELVVVGRMLHGAFTFDFDEIKQAYVDWGKNTLALTKKIVNGTVEEVKKGYGRMQDKIDPLTIGLSVEAGGAGGDTKTATGGKTATKTTTTKKVTGGGDSTAKSLEDIRKHNLEIVRKYEAAQTALETDEFEKRRKQTIANYSKQITDLQDQINTDKKLNAEGRAALNGTILALQEQQKNDLLSIEQDRLTQELNLQKSALALKLEGTAKGTEEELALKEQMIEKERQLALIANKATPAGGQSEADINKKFDMQKQAVASERDQLSLLQFDAQQALAASEFELLKSTEEEKTRFKLEQERERLKKILALNETASTKMSDEEVGTVKNKIAKIGKEIDAGSKDSKDIYETFGLKLSDEGKEVISESTQFAIDQVSSFLQAKVDAAQVAVDSSATEVEATQKRLDAEIEARNNGYASNVAMAQKELDQSKKNQEKALKEQEKAQKAQAAIETLQQTGNLITATAGIWKSFAGTGPWGIAAAIAGTALMWGSFAASKIKASQMTKQKYGEGGLEFLEGGSHASGNDIQLGVTKDGKDRRVEGGEALAIIRKSQARKYRKVLPGLIDSLNKGTFEKKYGGAYDTGGMTINALQSNVDIRSLENDVKDIKKQGERKYFVDGKGRTIETYKNLRRTYNAN